jgi:prepilin-type N-terminal cleavage/methylation domain-containing protein
MSLENIITKKNGGFSLVEVMIVTGVLGVLSLAVMNITKQSTKSSTKFQFDSDVILTVNEINGILSDPAKCLTTFTNATQAASPANPVLNATPANVFSPTGIAGIPSTTRKYTLTGGPYGNSGLMIASYSLDLGAIPDPLLTINFQNKAILGTGTIPKTIKLYVEKTGPGVITLCRSISTAFAHIWSHGIGSKIYYNGGNVGIGTSAPLDKLHVTGGLIRGQLNCQKVTGPTVVSSLAQCAGDEYVISGGGNCTLGDDSYIH